MKHTILLLLATCLYSQVQTPLVVLPGAGSSTGEVRLRERKNQAGDNYTGWNSPQVLSGNVIYEMPDTDGTIGQALVTNGALKTSWASVAGNSIPVCASTTGTDAYTCTVPSFTAYSANYCIILGTDTANTGTATLNISSVGVKSILRYGGSALVDNDILPNSPVMICYDGTDFQLPPSASPGSGAFLDGGNSFGAAATLGTNDTYNLIFERGGVPLVELSDTVFNIAPAGVANFATRVTKLDIGDISGAGGIWDIQATGSFLSSSSWKLRDNGGGRAVQIDRAISGTRTNNFGLFGSIIPRKRAIADGDDVDDSVFGNLGAPAAPWAEIYGAAGDFSGIVSAGTFNATNSAAYRVAGTTVIFGDQTARFTGLTMSTGASPGYVLTAVDGAGLSEWRVLPDSGFLVTNYGAVCDGVTDDTTAVQDAIDDAEAAGRGTIILPNGTCAVTTLTVSSNFIGFRGQGRSMSTLLGLSNAAVIHVDTTSGDIYAFEMSNMTLQPNGGTTSAGVTVDGVNDFMRSVFHNLYIASGRRGIWLKNSGYADWFQFVGNHCDMTLVTTGTCIDIETGLTSPGGVIANNQFIQGSGGTAIYYHGDFGDIVISGNHSESGAYFLNADCDSGGSPACTYGERLVVIGNKIDNATQPIRIDTVQNSRIIGNVVLGGIAAPVEVVGSSSGLEIDEDYNQGKRYIGVNGSTQVSPAKILLGDHTIDAANTNVGLSVVDAGASAFIGVGQSLANSAGFGWSYDATPANAYGLLYTFGATNSMKYIAAFHKFTGDIYPETDNAYLNGSAAFRWSSTAAVTADFSSTVGIGTSLPAAALHISATNAAIYMDGYSSVAPNILMRQSNGTAGAETATISGDRIGQVAMAGYGTSRVTAARIGGYAGSTFTATNAESYLKFETTASGSTTVTERWRIAAAGHLLAGADATYDIGAIGATRPRNYYGSGTGNFGGDVISSGNFMPSSSGGSDAGSAGTRFGEMHANNVFAYSGLELVSGDFTFTSSGNISFGSSGAVSIGTTSSPGNHFFANYMTTKLTHYIPSGGILAIQTGGSVLANGNTGFSGTKTVRDAAGSGTCTLVYDYGILTGGTC